MPFTWNAFQKEDNSFIKSVSSIGNHLVISVRNFLTIHIEMLFTVPYYKDKVLGDWYKYIEQSPERMTDTQCVGFIFA